MKINLKHEPTGINTALDRIVINNHDYKTGEIVTLYC